MFYLFSDTEVFFSNINIKHILTTGDMQFYYFSLVRLLVFPTCIPDISFPLRRNELSCLCKYSSF